MITTDYTKEANKDTLVCASLDKYRFTHWLCDFVSNFLSEPGNIKDERLRSLLWPQDGSEPDQCHAKVRVGLPMEKDSRNAGATPAILVSATEASYPVETLNLGVGVFAGDINALQMGKNVIPRKLGAKIAVVTESLDGTYLFSDIIEMYLLRCKHLVKTDNGAISQFNVLGSTGPQMIQQGQAGNAKTIYQDVISLSVIGSLAYVFDTAGPVYRGVTPRTETR